MDTSASPQYDITMCHFERSEKSKSMMRYFAIAQYDKKVRYYIIISQRFQKGV